MLKLVAGVLAGTVGAASVAQGAASLNERPYEIFSGELNGRLTMAIVNARGTAVAIEFHEERGRVVKGLAAGAILSDLQERAGDRIDPAHGISSGAETSSVRVNGQLLAGRASTEETIAAINALPHLSDAQKSELIALLTKP